MGLEVVLILRACFTTFSSVMFATVNQPSTNFNSTLDN